MSVNLLAEVWPPSRVNVLGRIGVSIAYHSSNILYNLTNFKVISHFCSKIMTDKRNKNEALHLV